MDKTHID